MSIWTAYFFVGMTLSFRAMAASDGHHGSVSDLIAPAVNVFILGAFLIYKLKKPLSNHFTQMSEQIFNTLERASLKAKEAQMMLESQKKKIAHLDQDITEIKNRAKKELTSFEQLSQTELEEKTRKLKTDAAAKIEAEKKAMRDELNAQVLDMVIAKTKNSIRENKDHQRKVSSRLLEGLKS